MSAGVTLTGRVVADPELRFSAKGNAVLKLRVVTAARKFDKDTQKWGDEDVTWWSVTAFKQLAENVAECLTKGDQVVVVGKVRSREYDDNEGNKRTAWEVVADHIAVDLSRVTVKVNRVAREKSSAPAEVDPWSTTGLVPVNDDAAPF